MATKAVDLGAQAVRAGTDGRGRGTSEAAKSDPSQEIGKSPELLKAVCPASWSSSARENETTASLMANSRGAAGWPMRGASAEVDVSSQLIPC